MLGVGGRIVPLLLLFDQFAVNANRHEIKGLPGSQNIDRNMKQYSGYLEASRNHYLFFWFVESQGDAATDPLIFWFNGGPGCSSIQGLLLEIGPFRVMNDGKTLKTNKYSWTEMASIVFIETPTEVGFSYNPKLSEESEWESDTAVAVKNYAAFKKFFKEFPAYLNHSIFIMGESYGAVYSSMLLEKIIDGLADFPIKIEGLAIGNGLLDTVLNQMGQLRFGYGFGFIGEKRRAKLVECCNAQSLQKCVEEKRNISANCTESVQYRMLFTEYHTYDYYRQCFLKELADGIRCTDTRSTEDYMNNVQVRNVLHVSEEASKKWRICDILDYTSNFGTIAQQIKKIVRNDIRVLLYHGDTDVICPALIGQIFSSRLGLKLVDKKRPWFIYGQLGGFKTEYKGLTYITIRGSGHMVPEWRPVHMFFVMQRFLKNESISDSIPSKFGHPLQQKYNIAPGELGTPRIIKQSGGKVHYDYSCNFRWIQGIKLAQN